MLNNSLLPPNPLPWFHSNNALSTSPEAEYGVVFTSRLFHFICVVPNWTLCAEKLWMGALLCPFKEGLCVFLWVAGGRLFVLFFWRVHQCMCGQNSCVPRHVSPFACVLRLRIYRWRRKQEHLNFQSCVIYDNQSGYSHNVRISDQLSLHLRERELISERQRK